MKLPIGTRSVLYGAHAFWLHPFFVAAAWRRIYGFPWDPRLWFCFFVHDLGYWGCANMDGAEGEAHVVWGARQAARLCGARFGNLCLYHSRFWAKRHNQPYSRLCVADKLSTVLMPWWLYLPMVHATGEIHEYMGLVESKYAGSNLSARSSRAWLRSIQGYLAAWVTEHQDGRADTWTAPQEAA